MHTLIVATGEIFGPEPRGITFRTPEEAFERAPTLLRQPSGAI